MGVTKDYYAVLGLSASADLAAIRSAYTARLRLYQSSVLQGDDLEIEHILHDLKEAFEVLADPDQRRAYDDARQPRTMMVASFQFEKAFEAEVNYDISDDEKWKYIADYFPEVQEVYEDIDKISASLSYSLKTIVLKNNGAEQADLIAAELKKEYLERNFGSDASIQEFVCAAFKEGRRDIALEIYKAIRFLGYPSPKNVKRFLRNVDIKFRTNYLRVLTVRAEEPRSLANG